MSYFVKEFNVIKFIISDVIKVLEKKGIIEKDYLLVDNCSYSIFLF